MTEMRHNCSSRTTEWSSSHQSTLDHYHANMPLLEWLDPLRNQTQRLIRPKTGCEWWGDKIRYRLVAKFLVDTRKKVTGRRSSTSRAQDIESVSYFTTITVHHHGAADSQASQEGEREETEDHRRLVLIYIDYREAAILIQSRAES